MQFHGFLPKAPRSLPKSSSPPYKKRLNAPDPAHLVLPPRYSESQQMKLTCQGLSASQQAKQQRLIGCCASQPAIIQAARAAAEASQQDLTAWPVGRCMNPQMNHTSTVILRLPHPILGHALHMNPCDSTSGSEHAAGKTVPQSNCSRKWRKGHAQKDDFAGAAP